MWIFVIYGYEDRSLATKVFCQNLDGDSSVTALEFDCIGNKNLSVSLIQPLFRRSNCRFNLFLILELHGSHRL
jgi:hypothetical protein